MAVTAIAAGGVGVARAVSTKTPSNAVKIGKGIDQFGLTEGWLVCVDHPGTIDLPAWPRRSCRGTRG